MEWDKERHYGVYIQVSHLSVSEIETSNALGIDTIVTHTRVEM